MQEDPHKHQSSHNSRRTLLEDDSSNEIFKSRSLVSVSWASLIFTFDIYILFTVIYWISVGILPSGQLLFFEITLECFLLCELALRVFLKLVTPQIYETLNLMHSRRDDSWTIYIVTFFGSIPWTTIHLGLDSSDEHLEKIYSRLLAFKFLRCFELWRIIGRIEEILFYKKFKTLVLVRSVKNLMYIFLTTHILSCGWLLIDTIHPHDMYEGISTNSLNPFRNSKEVDLKVIE
jgi:hypothetical protein